MGFKTLDYCNKIILAPMVRVGTLPMRLLALEFGADLVYTEEIVDWKLLNTVRKENDVLKTIDYINISDGSIVFRTCDQEKSKVIMQIGTSSPERALKIGKLIENDVAAIDINMGCPKEFSIKGGMGAALLSNRQNAVAILKILVDNLTIPISCKIRIMPDIKETLSLVRELQETGISAITIHGRTRNERPQNPVHIDVIKEVVNMCKIPVIANGGSKEYIEKYSDIIKFKKLCQSTSVMIARVAQWNVSIFRKEGMLPLDDVISMYLKLCVDYDNPPSNTKYCVQNMLRELQETPRGKKFLESQTLEQICDIWDLAKYCRSKQMEIMKLGNKGRREVRPHSILSNDSQNYKRIKLDNDIIIYNLIFIRANYTNDLDLPKSKLHLYALKNSRDKPYYDTIQEDKLFNSVLTFNKQKFASSFWEKNKKFAEQAAALVCLLYLQMENEDDLIENGSLVK